MTLANVRDWLKGVFPEADRYYIGRLDTKPDKAIGVYSRAQTGADAAVALGGLECTKSKTLPVSILIHWNDNARETEDAANLLFDRLLRADNAEIDDYHITYLRPRVTAPVDVSTDDGGIYERVIWLDIYYQKG